MSNWFIAYPVPAAPWLTTLPPAPAGLRLIGADDLHLTVAFFGRIEESHARRALASLPNDAIDRIEITLGAVVPMGNPHHPSALSALVEESAASGRSIADAIRGLRDALLAAAGIPPDSRAPRPHITVARIARKADDRKRSQALEWAATVDVAGVRLSLDGLALYTAGNRSQGRAYELMEYRAARNA